MSGKPANFFKRLLHSLATGRNTDRTSLHNRSALAESEYRYRTLVEMAPIAILVHQGGKVIMANEQAVDLLGARSKTELIGRPILAFVHPDFHEFAQGRLTKLYKSGGGAPLAEEVFLRLDGSSIDVEVVSGKITAHGKPAIQTMVRDISERKQARQKLVKAKEQAEYYFNMAATIMFVLNKNGEVEVINQKGVQTLGLPASEIIGKSWMDHFVPEEIRGFLKEKLEEAVQNGILDLQYFENEIIRADGSRRLIAWHNQLLLDGAGNFKGVIASGEDITFQRKAEGLLKNREQSLREAEQIALLGSWTSDPETGEGEWSDTMYEIMVRDRAQGRLPREEFVKMVHPDDREKVVAGIQQLFENGVPVNMPFRLVFPSGQIKYMEAKGAVRKMQDKGLQKSIIYGTFQDITERKQAEEALRVSEQKYRALFEKNLSGVFRIDLKEPKTILECNAAFALMLGFSDPAEVIGKAIADIFDSATSTDYFSEILKHGQLFNWESKITLHNGRTIYTLENSTLQYEDGLPRYLDGTVFDITPLKEAEEERTQLLEQLIWQNKNLEEFAYVVSHNLRSPVSSLLGLTQLAKTHPDEPETIRDILEKISTVSHSLDQVIKDLNTALTVQQKQTLNKEAIDLIELLHEIQNILQPELEHCEVDFKTTLEVNALVSVRSYLHNILYNLVHNAIKYRHPDRKPSISISSRLTDEGVQLQVEDNGLGLDAERIGEKLFGLYQRFHLHVPGKGIGLYLVKSQVEALGGSITVRSKPDEGSTFTVLLP